MPKEVREGTRHVQGQGRRVGGQGCHRPEAALRVKVDYQLTGARHHHLRVTCTAHGHHGREGSQQLRCDGQGGKQPRGLTRLAHEPCRRTRHSGGGRAATPAPPSWTACRPAPGLRHTRQPELRRRCLRGLQEGRTGHQAQPRRWQAWTACSCEGTRAWSHAHPQVWGVASAAIHLLGGRRGRGRGRRGRGRGRGDSTKTTSK